MIALRKNTKGKNEGVLMGMKLHKLIKPELEFYKEHCNFTLAEAEIFDLLAKGLSIKQISMKLCLSEPSVHRKIKDIRTKIDKINNFMK